MLSKTTLTEAQATDAVELHFYRDTDATAFLVAVPDAALVRLNKGHPIRGLTIAFNSLGPKSQRLFALARAVKEAEEAGVIHKKPSKRWYARASRAVARCVVAVVYPVASLFRRKGGAK